MKKLGILILPFMAFSLLTNCGPTYTVTWKNWDGEILKREKNVEYGTVPVYGETEPTKPADAQYTYHFVGWNGDITKGIVGNTTFIAQFDYEINKYTIYWKNGDGSDLQVDNDVPYGSIPSEYEPTTTPTKAEDEIGKYEFVGWNEDINEGIVGDTTFTPKFKTIHKYKVNVDLASTERLTFSTTDDKELEDIIVYEGEDFNFKVTVKDDASNAVDYVVPSALSILVENVGTLDDGYVIESPGETTSLVKILGSKIKGNIVISGSAAEVGFYDYQVSSHYGLEEITSGSADVTKNLVVTFVPSTKETNDGETYNLPGAENIYINFDNKKWVCPADADSGEYCSYDDMTGELTILAHKAENNVDIKVRASDFPLLDSMSWEEISNRSFLGSAPYIFYLGEEKTVVVNKQAHQVRIVGFNHDIDENEQSLGITFEFKNLISDENGYSLASFWQDTKHSLISKASHDYLNSSIRKNLTGHGNGVGGWYEIGKATKSTTYKNKTVCSMLPSDLQSVLKTTRKEVNTMSKDGWMLTNVDDKLFMLSAKELDFSEEYIEDLSTYSYYKDATDDDRIKQQIKGAEGALTSPIPVTDSLYGEGASFAGYNSPDGGWGSYLWTRSPVASPSLSYGTTVWTVSRDGSVNPEGAYDCAFAVAPAFCV